MRTEKIFKRENGDQVKISVSLHTDFSTDVAKYNVGVSYLPYRKRNWIFPSLGNDYTYRSLPFGGKEREAYELNNTLKYCTIEEINEVKMKLWNLLKP